MANSSNGGRPQRREDLASWYSEVLADQVVSGLSVAEYAVALGVTPTTLYQWRRRLSTQTSDKTAKGRRPRPTGLIQVSMDVEERPPFVGQASFVVRLAAERCVEVPSDFDDETLRRLVTVLEGC